MSLRKKIALSTVALCAVVAGFAGYIRSVSPVPILMYHSVHPEAASGNRLEITVDVFERQMKFLKERKFNVVSVTALAGMLARREPIPHKTIAITFDDGYRNNYEYVFPVLKKYGIHITLFIITDEVGRPQGDRVTWDEILEMQASGLVTIGSHTLSPRLLTEMPEAEARRQITESKRLIEEKTGRRVAVISYPEGRFNRVIRQMAIDAGYACAVATHPGRQYPDDDIFALKRLRISRQSDSLVAFWVKVSGYYDFFKERKRKQD